MMKNNYEFWHKYLSETINKLDTILLEKTYIYTDFHMHSNHSSDGQQTLEQIIIRSQELGLDVISITDHDSIKVYDDLYEYLQHNKLNSPIIIPGVEFTVENDEYGSQFHVLQFMINPKEKSILQDIYINERVRWIRVKKQFIRISENETLQYFFNKYNIQCSEEEYKNFIGRGNNAYVPVYKNKTVDVLNLIINSGGIPVLAHLDTLELNTNFDELIPRLISFGLKGIETNTIRYKIKASEIIQIDLNRSGVFLENGEVKEDFRVRFKGKILDDVETWYALPVRSKEDTPFRISNGIIYFKNIKIGLTGNLMLDTCETSYQRGPHLLNLNSRSRSNCGGCKACIHTYRKIYDNTVIKDQESLDTKEDIKKFFESQDIDVSKLVQIAIVTGLFKSEENVVNHMKLISEVVTEYGFKGELMYFGCEINSEWALKELSKLGKFSLIYALDNFSKRELLLSKTKSLISIDDAKNTLDLARKFGIKTTISYISGLDSLEDMTKGFTFLKDSFTHFPIINVYQTQTIGQANITIEEARELEYYLKSRVELEKIFKDTNYRPKRWENYRPLWYKYFDNEELPNNSFGQLENL